MSHASQADRKPADVEAWRRDSKPEIVASHLDARAMERRVVMGCACIGSIGIVILLAVVLGSSPIS